jgi:uncharacterized membrane protein
MPQSFYEVLLLIGLAGFFLWIWKRRALPNTADPITSLQRSLAEFDARLRHLEQWAMEQPGSTFKPAVPTTVAATPSLQPGPADMTPAAGPGATMPPSLPLNPPPLPVAAPLAAAPAGALPASTPHSGVPLAPTADGGDAVVPAVAPATSEAREPTGPPALAWSFADLEQLLSGRGLAWIGGLAILIGALFFLGLAFTQGLIPPVGRVAIGLVAGTSFAMLGAWFFERREALFGHVVLAVGLGTIAISLVAATRLYELMPAPAGLLASLATALAATIIAVRARSEVVAGYGLITALAAPPLLGADPNLTTVAFLATALVGTTTIALYRSWFWLPSLAFLLAAPQLWLWLESGPVLGIGMSALLGFGMLNGIAAGGEEFRLRRQRLHPTSATLLLANAAFLVAAGFLLLDVRGAQEGRGLYLVTVALAHFGLGAYFLFDQGERHPFGMLAFGTGIAALSMAVPIQLGGAVVPIAWAAEAVALTWVYARRNHGWSGVVGSILGTLAVLYLLLVEYPFWQLQVPGPDHRSFLNASGGTLGFMLLVLGVAGLLVRQWLPRALLAFVGLQLTIYALPFELSGLPLIGGWAALCVLAITAAAVARSRVREQSDIVQIALLLPALIAGGLALAVAVAVELSPDRLGNPPATPFVDRLTVTALILIIGSLVSAIAARAPLPRRLGIVTAIAIAAYLMPFELVSAGVVVAWSVLALLLAVVGRRDEAGAPIFLASGGLLLGVAVLLVLSEVAPPSRLVVSAWSTIDHPLFWSGATAALGAIIIALLAGAWLYPSRPIARWSRLVAGVLAVYLLSVGVVDAFQQQVTRGMAAAPVGKQAQVALSILWAAVGGATFVVGVRRWAVLPRVFGLALLILATIKVFLYDLASLDATYKVLSFIGLGLLLLASSYAYQRLKPRPAGGSVVDQSGLAPESH